MNRAHPLLAGVVATAVSLLLSPAVVPAGLAAQSSCAVDSRAPGGTVRCTARMTVTLQLPALATLAMSSATTSLTAGRTPAELFAADTGYVVAGPLLSVLANRDVAVTLVNAPLFTGPAAKSASDVGIAVGPAGSGCAGAPTVPLSAAPAAAQQGAPRLLFSTSGPTLGSSRQLCFRARWRADSDVPGSYTLPLEVTLTAP